MPKELIAIEKGKVTFREYEDLPPGENQLLIRSEYSSCKHGTENWIIQGKAHWLTHKRDREMRIFTEPFAESMFPQPLGNMVVGIVEQIGAGVEGFQPEDRVCFRAGARDSHTVSAADVRKMKPEMTWQEAVCLEPAEFALGALRDSHIRLGDRIGVFGMGAIGLLAIQMAKLQGASVVVAVDPVETRRQLALELGADLALDPTECDAGLEIRKKICRMGLDVTIDFSGSSKALNDCIRSTAYGGTVVIGAMSKPATDALKLGMEFHWNRIKIVSSRACNEPDFDHPRWSNQRLIESAYELLLTKRLRTDSFIKPVVPFSEAVSHYQRLETDPDSYIKLSFIHG